MNKEFIPYEQALELKELGFKEECAAHYLDVDDLELKWKIYRNLSFNTNNCLQAPLYQQAFSWFRENYELDSEIYMNHEYGVKFYTYLVLKLEKSIVSHKSGYAVKQNTYEEAELTCLRKLIEIVKQSKSDE
jgi:hypothetical protein